MKITSAEAVKDTNREVHCPNGGFISYRMLLESDGMGFGLHKTVIPKGPKQHWHYKHHKEACYCIQGRGYLTDAATGNVFEIVPGKCYVLDKHDDHYFQAVEEVVLISVFNPPVTGREVHDETGSYKGA
jgi:L-ectoine synthase